jgi:type II secretory pathway component PulF
MIRRRKLIDLCHQLGNLLDAGVPIRRALHTIESGARAGRFRQAISAAAAAVDQAESLEAAFGTQKDYFPILFLRLIQVGEKTGTVERVLRHMAEYLEVQDRLFKNTVSNLIYPAVQFTVAILVIALAKYIIGMLGMEQGGKSDIASPIAAFGATGTGAAAFFLLKWFGSVGALIGGYIIIVKVLRGKRLMDEILLRVPVIGYALRTLAVARFCWALQLMQKAGVNILDGIEGAFQATNNAAFTAKTTGVLDSLRNGNGLRASLEATHIFPRPMLEVVEVGETSGKLDQCLEKAAQQTFENAGYAMRAMAQAFTWAVWALVAGMLLYYIFSFYRGYFGMYKSLLSGEGS